MENQESCKVPHVLAMRRGKAVAIGHTTWGRRACQIFWHACQSSWCHHVPGGRPCFTMRFITRLRASQQNCQPTCWWRLSRAWRWQEQHMTPNCRQTQHYQISLSSLAIRRIGERVMRAIAREKYEESSSTQHQARATYWNQWMDSQRTCVRSNDARGISTRLSLEKEHVGPRCSGEAGPSD